MPTALAAVHPVPIRWRHRTLILAWNGRLRAGRQPVAVRQPRALRGWLGARVVAVDVAAAALPRARDLGAECAVDASRDPDPAATIRELTNGGAAASVDALGSPATAVSSVRCLRRRGRHIQVGLLLGATSTPPLPMDLVVARELEVYGSHGMAARAYPPMLALVADRALRPDLLVGEVIGLADAGEALTAMGQRHPPPG